MGTIDTVPLRVPVTDSGYRVPIGFGEDSDSPTVVFKFSRAGIKLELAVESAHTARARNLVIVMTAERGQGLG